jgi:uncharacterized protein with PIN domain
VIVDSSALVALIHLEVGYQRSERQPLLYVGDDFTHTDIEAA